MKSSVVKITHIYWFSYFNLDEASVRYRAKFPLMEMAQSHGISSSIFHPEHHLGSYLYFLKIFIQVLLFRKRNSLLVFQKIYTNGFYAKALKFLLFFRPNNTLYDIDDAEYTRRPADTIQHFMKRCKAISCGSQALVDYAQQFNKNAFLLTSPVIEHGRRKTSKNETLTVGWIGYYGAHRDSLKQLFFPGLLQATFPVKLIILGIKSIAERQELENYFHANSMIEIEAPLGTNWQDEDSVYKIISGFDVGVSPLLDTEFNRAKSAFKLKQCMSCGVPVLCNGLGENKAFLREGENGFYCHSPAEFLEKLSLFYVISAPDYAKLSKAALATFPAFSVDFYCKKLLAQLPSFFS